MRLLAGLGGATAAAILMLTVGQAEAAQHPRVPPGDCQALVAARGPHNVWQVSFYGERKDLWDNISDYSASPCFASLANCKAWLYWAMSDWPDRNNSTLCRRGVGY